MKKLLRGDCNELDIEYMSDSLTKMQRVAERGKKEKTERER